MMETINENPFNDAFNEAILVGNGLANLIIDSNLAGNCTFNLVGFSLGTQVVHSCLQQLNRKNKLHLINDVLLMGGVVDVKLVNVLDLHKVKGTFYNLFIDKDSVLKYVLKIPKFGISPVGIQEIRNDIYAKIVNVDMSLHIDGHNSYFQKLDLILSLIDFSKRKGTNQKLLNKRKEM